MNRILSINPGSTSTKLAIFDDDKKVFEETIRHSKAELSQYANILEQREMRQKIVTDTLKKNDISIKSITAIVGRGGLIRPVDSGTYLVNDAMMKDLISDSAMAHASALGGIIARQIGDKYGISAYVVDPIVVDEMEPRAKLSGIPGIERKSVFHALNTKAIARRAADALEMEYESARLVVAHMGGGITVGAHWYGRVVDVNDGVAGEGPFSPERSGAVPLSGIIDMCFSGDYTKEEMKKFMTGAGGLSAYLGTNDLQEVEAMIKSGDDYAALVVDSMAYQVIKEIGAMAAVLEGRVDAIVLTGGLAYSNRFTGAIKQHTDQIAPVLVFPGEDEMLALTEGVLRILQGKAKLKEYK
ncbi:butyrate kinase [Clostridiaceae bacterium OttesenSCG-928-D20]|nr:butyrate kinase [Clostridiaceae bacterium OttesenSCG-928-D20]